MSKIFTGILGAIAVSMSFGAVQFALGRDLSGGMESAKASLGTSEAAINRAAKADRPAGISRSAVATRTISLKLDGLSDTSVLVRIPVAQADHGSFAPSMMKSGHDKPSVACEPVVSVLTEVAKQLQPGRCVT
jgi:hypothetical protein